MILTIIKKRDHPYSTWECVDENGDPHDCVDLKNGTDIPEEKFQPGTRVFVASLIPYIELGCGQKIIKGEKT